MNPKQLWSRRRPHLWFQLYWVVYLIWFFWLDLTIKDPKYIIHAPLDDLIPFNEWFIFPYCSWFVLLAGVTALLWWCDTQIPFDKKVFLSITYSESISAIVMSAGAPTESVPPGTERIRHGFVLIFSTN